ncbi:MAG: hypothetical protein AAB490_05045 [Patescibacteria group bacterium]
MELVLDFSVLTALASQSPLMIAWILFLKGGWVIVFIMAVWAGYQYNLLRLQGKYLGQFEKILLAIDIPKDSEQTPKAMEQVFATLSGAHSPHTKYEQYIKGHTQLSFSFEIISIDGYLQFLIRTPKVFRDLVEGAIYAHYPDAEITEVEDYTKDIPKFFPNDQYNVWGSELQLSDNEALPIRTYESFEDKLTQEFKDPLSGLLETMSRIQKGEQVWFQVIIRPIENTEWVKKHINFALKKAGKKVASEKSGSWTSSTLSMLSNLLNWFPWLQTQPSDKRENQFDFRIMNLTPGERSSIEAIERKASKIGFRSKVRLVYVAPHELYNSRRVVSSVFGAIKQLGDLTSNSLKPNKRTKTQAAYFNARRRVEARRRRIISNYKARSWYSGSKFFVLNTEELATIYHFPSITITTPYLKRTEAKKSDGPAHLPSVLIPEDKALAEDTIRKQLVGLNLDNTYYERLYRKGATQTNPTPPAKQPAASTENLSVPNNLPIR